MANKQRNSRPASKVGVAGQKPAKRRLSKEKKSAIIWGSILGVILLFIISAGVIATSFSGKALPGTYVEGVKVSGKTADEIKTVVNDQVGKIGIIFNGGDKTATANATQLGIQVDTEATARAALNSGNGESLLTKYNPFSRKDVDIAVTYDEGKLQDFLNTNFASFTTQPKDASLKYDEASQRFVVVPGTPGKTMDAKKLRTTLSELVASPTLKSVKVEVGETAPIISDKAAAETRDFMNKRLGLALNMNYKGQLLYFVDPPDIASWADFTPNPNTGKIDVDFDKAKIKQFLTTKVASSVATSPQNKKVLVNKKGKEIMVVQEGVKGHQPKDMDGLIDKIYSAVTNDKAMEEDLKLVEVNYKTIKVVADDTKWIDVDLSKQTTTLYQGPTAIRTFIISSGVAKYPTVVGTFRVWYKTPNQTMTGGSKASGDYYSLPNVKWDTYFHEDYAFHTAYWHNNFGVPMSHGCINMREADAKVVYDFAPVGTKVVVHY